MKVVNRIIACDKKKYRLLLLPATSTRSAVVTFLELAPTLKVKAGPRTLQKKSKEKQNEQLHLNVLFTAFTVRFEFEFYSNCHTRDHPQPRLPGHVEEDCGLASM